MNRLAICVLLALTAAMPAHRALADDEAEHQELQKLKAVYEDAVNSGDLDKFAPYLSKDFTAVLATGEEVKGLDELKAFWQKTRNLIGPGGTYHESIDPDRSQLFGDIAVAHGHATVQVTTSSGENLDFHSSWTCVAHKEDGQWKLVRAEATMNPFANDLITKQTKRVELLYGIGGVVAGFVVGFIVRSMRRRA